jgi:multidrug efflux pump subunit AcrA (membrane-fusion protein)
MTVRCFGVVRGSIHTAASPLNPETVEMSLQAQSSRPVKRIMVGANDQVQSTTTILRIDSLVDTGQHQPLSRARMAPHPRGSPAWRLKAVLNVLADA